MAFNTTDMPLRSSNSNRIDYPEGVLIVAGTSCCLSIVGAAVIFGTYALIPPIRGFTRTLIVCLTVADLISALGYMMSVIRYAHGPEFDDVLGNTLCHAQASVTTYSSLASFLFTISIAIHVFSAVFCHPEGKGNSWLHEPGKTLMILVNGICWTVPAVIVGIAESYHALGEDVNEVGATGPWCWVDTRKPHHWVWQVIAGKGLEILTYLVTCGLHVLFILSKLWFQHREGYRLNYTNMRTENRSFVYIWLVLYVIRMWGTIRFFASVIDTGLTDSNIAMEVLLYLQAFGDPAQSFCNCILFCVCDSSVRRYLICRCCHRGTLYEDLDQLSTIATNSCDT